MYREPMSLSGLCRESGPCGYRRHIQQHTPRYAGVARVSEGVFTPTPTTHQRGVPETDRLPIDRMRARYNTTGVANSRWCTAWHMYPRAATCRQQPAACTGHSACPPRPYSTTSCRAPPPLQAAPAQCTVCALAK